MDIKKIKRKLARPSIYDSPFWFRPKKKRYPKKIKYRRRKKEHRILFDGKSLFSRKRSRIYAKKIRKAIKKVKRDAWRDFMYGDVFANGKEFQGIAGLMRESGTETDLPVIDLRSK